MRSTILIILALCLASLARAEESEQRFLLVDDFSDGDLKSETLGSWQAFDDRDRGGSSVAALAIDENGHDDDAAARLTFALGEPYQTKAGKGENPRAFLSLLSGEKYGVQKDFSEHEGVRFWAHATGLEEGCLLILAMDGKDLTYWSASFPVGEEWAEVEVPWTDLSRLGGEAGEQLVPSGVTMIALGTGFEMEPGAKGDFFIDDFGFARISEKELKKRAAETVEHGFQRIAFHAPAHGWSWDGKKLKAPGKGCELEFKSYIIEGYNRVPFGEGLSADPGNVGELEECLVASHEMFGLSNLERTKRGRVKIGRKSAHRFGFSADLSKELSKAAPQLGKRVFIEVLLLKEAGSTYQVKAVMPLAARDELLPVVRRIVSSIRPRS